MMNKKGDEKILIFYWIIILIIITIGIVAGVVHVFGSNLDIRKAEAGLLKEKLVDCLVDKGELNSRNYNSVNLLETCKINLNDNTAKYKGIPQYAINLNLDGSERNFGNSDLLNEALCNQENQPACISSIIYVLENNQGKFLAIKIAVRKTEKNE